MNDVSVKNSQNSNLPILYFVGAWMVYAVIYSVFKNVGAVSAGMLSLLSNTALIGIAAVLSFSLIKKAQGLSKVIFGFFAISFVGVFFDNFIYHFVYNVLHISSNNVSKFLISSYNIPNITFFLFQFLAFAAIFPKIKIYNKKTFANILLYAPILIIVSILATTFLMASTTNFAHFSLDVFYDFAELILQLSCFIVAVLCLAVSRNKGLTYLSMGHLLDLAVVLIMGTGIFSQAFRGGYFIESFWVLAWLLRIYGLFYFKRSGTYNEAPINWTYAYDSLKSQTTYWCIAAGLLTASLGLVVSYVFLPSGTIFF